MKFLHYTSRARETARNLNDLVLCSTLGPMNFQKWELFSGSSGMFHKVLLKMKVLNKVFST